MAKCHVCEKETGTSWCLGCAKDVCRECRATHTPECLKVSGKACHVCGKPADKMVEPQNLHGIVIQNFTGRVFCGGKCWGDYKESEGF